MFFGLWQRPWRPSNTLAASLQAGLPRGGVEDFARGTGQSVPGGLSASPSLQDLLPKNEVYRFLKGKK